MQFNIYFIDAKKVKKGLKWMYTLISDDFTFCPLVMGSVHLCAISTARQLPSLSYQVLIYTWVEVKHASLKCLTQMHKSKTIMSQHWEGRNMIFLWNLQQAGITRQAAVFAKCHSLAIVSHPSRVYTIYVGIEHHFLCYPQPIKHTTHDNSLLFILL